MTGTRLAAVLTAGTLGAASVAGVAYSASAQTPTPKPGASSAAPGHARREAAHRPRPVLQILAHVEYATITRHTPQGARTLDLQRGTASAVSPSSITVTSPDLAHSYTVTSTTRVRVDGKRASIDAVHTGDRVGVVASTTGQALLIVDRGPAPAH